MSTSNLIIMQMTYMVFTTQQNIKKQTYKKVDLLRKPEITWSDVEVVLYFEE